MGPFCSKTSRHLASSGKSFRSIPEVKHMEHLEHLEQNETTCPLLHWLDLHKERAIDTIHGWWIWSSFSLALIHRLTRSHRTTQTHLQKTMRAKELQDYNRNTSTRTSIAYCLLLMKQGASPMAMTLCQTTAQIYSKCNNFVSCVLNLYSLEYWINIDYQYFTLNLNSST